MSPRFPMGCDGDVCVLFGEARGGGGLLWLGCGLGVALLAWLWKWTWGCGGGAGMGSIAKDSNADMDELEECDARYCL